MALVTRMSAVFLFVLLAGAAAAQEARTGIREGGRTIGAGQVTEILDRVGIREGGRTIGAGQVTEILDRVGIREGGRTIGAAQVTEILERTAGGRAGGRSAKDERGRGRDR